MCSNDQMLIQDPSWTEAKRTLPTKHTHPATTAPPTYTQEPPRSHTTTTSTYTTNRHTHTHHQPLLTQTHIDNKHHPHTTHPTHSFTRGMLQKCSPYKWVRGNMKNKNPQQHHLYSLFFSLFQSLYLCITLTQILTLTLEREMFSTFDSNHLFYLPQYVCLESPDSVTLGKRVCSVCLKTQRHSYIL